MNNKILYVIKSLMNLKIYMINEQKNSTGKEKFQ